MGSPLVVSKPEGRCFGCSSTRYCGKPLIYFSSVSVSFGRFVLNYYRQVSKSRRLVGLDIGLNGGVFAADYIIHYVALPCFAIALNASKSRQLVGLVSWLNGGVFAASFVTRYVA